MTLPDTIRTGQTLVHIATGTVFRVLCNCAHVSPRLHTQRFISNNRELFRTPTPEELLAFTSPTPTSRSTQP